MTVLGDDITYQRGQTTYSITGMIDNVGKNEQISELHTEATFLKTALAITPQRGDKVIGLNQTYTVERIIPTDDAFYRLLIK